MTKDEYLKYHAECLAKMTAITKAKNHDYTGDSGDPFFNFTRVEKMDVASTEQGFLTRILDKYSRLTTFVKKGVLKVKDESIEDTLLDMANYAILFSAYIKSKKRKEDLSIQPELPLYDQYLPVPSTALLN